VRPGNLTIILLFLFPIATSRATETAPSPDFSAGFTQLAALGLPGLDGQAKWCAHPEAGSINYEMREVAKSIKGNAWLLPSADGKLRFVPIGGVEIIELDLSKKGGTGGGSAKKAEPTILQDPSKDVEAIVSGLNKLAAKRDPDDRFSYSSRSNNFGGLLLLAAQLHQTGRTELANKLAVAVFGVYPSREAAVDSAIDKLADHFYQQATRAFFKSGDWAAYQQSLAALVKRFPRGWSSKDAVAIFLPQLEKQAAGAKAPVPSLPNIVIDPPALDIIRELTEKPPAEPKESGAPDADAAPPGMRHRMRMMGYMGEYGGNEYSPSSLWLIEESPDPKETKSPLARLAALKMAALPALAALAADPFLTHLPNPGSHSGYFSPDESSDERTLRAYASLNRPSTRGEIARKLLTVTLPDPQDELDDADPDTIRELALEFWKQHKTASREELAAVFLRDGSRGQASQAATILASSSDPNAHKIFEAHILASDQAIGYFQEVQTYLKSRKAAAKPFLDSYSKLVRSQTSDDDMEDNEYRWQVKEAGGVAKILKQLESLVGGQSPRALAVQIAKGKPEDADAAIRTLTALLEDSSPTKHLFALLEGANAATDAGVRARFLGATLEVSWKDDVAEDEEDAAIVERKLTEPEAVIWRKMLADTREIPGRINRFSNEEEKSTVSELAASTFEYSISPRNYYKAMQIAPVLSKPVSAILAGQADARLSNKPVPPLPDASRVSEERLASIVSEAGTKPAAEIHPYLKTLTPDERAAWFDWHRNPGKIADPESVKGLRILVVEKPEKSPWPYPVLEDTGGIDIGFTVTPASIRSYVANLAKDTAKRSRTTLWLKEADFGPGLEVLAINFPFPEPKPETETDEEQPVYRGRRPDAASAFSSSIAALREQESAEGVIVVALGTRTGEQGEVVWLIEKGEAKPVDADKQAALDTSIEQLAENQDFRSFYISIQILSKADADKLAESDPNENDPFSE
jgi:hypothetical protein